MMMHVLSPSKHAFFYSVLVAVFLLATPTRAGMVVNSTDVPHTIGDQGDPGTISTLIGPSLTITDLNVIIDDFQTPFVQDYRFELTSPEGTNVLLIASIADNGILSSLNSQSAMNFENTVFDDEATTNLENGSAPYSGSFNIDHSTVPSPMDNGFPLSAFDGEVASGTWTLTITDQEPMDTATLVGWSLEFTGTSVPEPSSFLFLGLTAIAAMGWKRFCLTR